MTAPLVLTYAGRYTVTVDSGAGRALRFGEGGYPLFRPPDAREVAAPDDCLSFLRELHLSLCPVFDSRLRQWVGRYFETIVALADTRREALAVPAGTDGAANAHRVWALGALRPLVLGCASLPAGRVEAPALLWTGARLVAVRFDPPAAEPEGVETRLFPRDALEGPPEAFLAALGDDVAQYWRGLSAPRHPFARGPFAGLGAGSRRS